MKHGFHFPRFWQPGVSIKMRLMFGIGLFFVLMTLPFAMLLVVRSIKDHGDRVIAESKEIQHLVLEMDRGMEKAHRCHSSFFLYASERGFATAHEEYAQPSIRYIAQVVTLSETLKSRFRQIDDESWYHGNQVDVNFFLSSAKRFASVFIEAVELFTLLHAPERGLQSQLDQVIDAIASELRTEDTSSHLLMEMRIPLQKYWSVRQRPVMQTALNALFLLRRDVLHNQALEENKRQQLAGLMGQVTIIIDKILATETAIKSRLNDLSLQSVATEKVSELLLRRAGEEVSKAEQNMRRIRMLPPIIMTAITLSGLILAMVLARMINRTVLLRVARLTEVAGEIRAGNLEVLAPEGDNDELGTLGRTFNFMLARFKVSITTLESQVEQRTAELSASEKRFRQLFEHSSNGVIVYKSCDHGEDFIIRDCNKAVESIEQRTRQEMIGRRVTEVFPGIRPFGLLAVMQAVWKTGQTAHHPVGLYVDNKTQGWRENGVYKLPSGEIVCVYDDRTAQKQAEAELQAITMKLQRIQKMEALGLMAGGVAHDLNNILSGIVGFPDLLLMHLPPDSPLGKLVLTIKESGLRAAAVVADLLTVARGVASKKEMRDLNALVNEYLHSPEHQMMVTRYPHIECTTTLVPSLPLVFCSDIHIKKCIMNLVNNAMEAMDGTGRIDISTCFELVDVQTAAQKKIRTGSFVVLRVSDNGQGISERDLERIFEPFYSKKVMGVSGTGLGLAVVWNSVADHNGAISVQSDPTGTHFSLYFPVSTGPGVEQAAPRDGGGESPWGRGEKVLVVDDEGMLRNLASSMLEKLGYKVEQVSSGEQAVEYLQKNPVDLLILDMIMLPGINGRETYEQIIAFAPGQKAIIVSGFAEGDDLRTVQSLGAKGFVKKPYSLEQLGQAVRKELDR